jgi:toxin CcdB
VVIRRFDIFENPNPRTVRTVPYLMVLQSELLDGLATQVVVPLVKPLALGGKAAARLNPIVSIDGEDVVMLTQQVGAVATRSLTKRVGNVADHREAIVGALDFLFSGI